MHGNSIIPTAAMHDRHYAHACIVCEEDFTRHHRPAGEVRFCGAWGDACPACYDDYRPDPEKDPNPTTHAHHLLTAALAPNPTA